MDSSGNLYGTTDVGGTSNKGTVFELAQGSGTITTLASFGGSNGANPFAGLIMDSSGNLYGTTESGGPPSGYGTVFKLAKGSKTITDLASFNGSNGACPEAGLIMDSSGNLYGTTAIHRFQACPGKQHHHHPGVDKRRLWGNSGWGAAHGQQRQSLWHDRAGGAERRRHGFRGGHRQRRYHDNRVVRRIERKRSTRTG